MVRKMIHVLFLVSMLIALFPATGMAEAWSGCGSYYTVQWGDTLSGIAVRCGTSMYAIRQMNPGLYNWVYAGQVLAMPGSGSTNYGGYAIHVVAFGDTLKNIAARYGVSMWSIANLNGIYNFDLIYVGQRLKIPSGSYVPPAPPPPPAPGPYSGSTYVVQRGDTLRILANRWGVSIFDILAANPQITNANFIFVGQVINVPGASGNSAGNPSYYTVQQGDTLRIIADRYGTTVYNLQLLNPQIWNPNWIFPGMVIRVG